MRRLRPGCFHKSELHYGLTLVPTGIDPQINASSELGIPLASVYDTLVFRDPAGGFVPGLAQRWDISSDGLQYTFTLRDDVHFQDGTPFNAYAVKVNLDRVLDPANGSQLARFMIEPVQSVTVVDDFTVRLQLSEPFAPLLDSLSQVYLGMASPAALQKWGKDYSFHQVGTGPFRFVEYVAGDHLTLERNPDYAWGPSIYRNKTALVQKIVFRFYEDPATRAPALLSGEEDVMGEVLPLDAQTLAKDNRFSVDPVSVPGQPLQFLFNTKQAPTDDMLVRQALLEATDREALVQTVFGSFSPVATGPLTASTWGASAVTPASTFNLEDAAALLTRAGWVDSNGDGVRERNGLPLRLKLVYPPWGLTPQTADLLELQWKKIGVAVDLIQAPTFSALIQAQSGGAYNLISLNLSGTDPYLLQSFYQTGAEYDWSGVEDARLDSLLLAAERPETRRTGWNSIARSRRRSPRNFWSFPSGIMSISMLPPGGCRGCTFRLRVGFPILIDVNLG